METKIDDEEDLDAILALVERLVTVPVIVAVLEHAGLFRSSGSIMNDAARGILRMGKLSDRFLVTTETEMQRYVRLMVKQQLGRKTRTPTGKRFLDKIAERQAAA